MRQVLHRLLDRDKNTLHRYALEKLVKGFPSRRGLVDEALILSERDGHRGDLILCRHLCAYYSSSIMHVHKSASDGVTKRNALVLVQSFSSL